MPLTSHATRTGVKSQPLQWSRFAILPQCLQPDCIAMEDCYVQSPSTINTHFFMHVFSCCAYPLIPIQTLFYPPPTAWTSMKNVQHHLWGAEPQECSSGGEGAELLTKREEAGLCLLRWPVGRGRGTSAFSVCLITDLMSPGGSGCRTALEDSDLPAPSSPEVDIHVSFVRRKRTKTTVIKLLSGFCPLVVVLAPPPPHPPRVTDPIVPPPPHKGTLASKKVLQRKSNPGTPSSHGRVDGLASEGNWRAATAGQRGRAARAH